MNSGNINRHDLLKLLNALKLLDLTHEEFMNKIVELDNLIKSASDIRNDIPSDFYLVLIEKLQVSISGKFYDHIQMITKCLKNSAAAFKNDFDKNESEICTLLIGYLNDEINASDSSFDLNILISKSQNEAEGEDESENDSLFTTQKVKHLIYQNVFQYIFNLIQG